MNLLLVCLVSSLGAAAVPLPSALEVAADAQRANAERMQAFDALLRVPHIAELGAVAADSNAHMRQRWIAVRALGKIGGDPVRDTLTPLLRAPEAALRAATASALGDAEIRGMAMLVSELLNVPAVIVRAAAADALGQMGDSVAVPRLLDALEDPSNVYRGQSLWVRRHYVQAIGQIGTENGNGNQSALGGLIGALNDPDPAVQAAALNAIERIVGHSYGSGRSVPDQVEAWKRWWANQQPRR